MSILVASHRNSLIMSFRRSERSRLLHQETQYQNSRWKEFKCWLRRKVFRRISWWKALAINADEKPAESFSGGKNSEKAPTKVDLAAILVETPEDPAATPCKESNKPRQATNKPRQTTKGTSGKTTHISLASRLAINNPRLSGFCFQASRRKLRNPSF